MSTVRQAKREREEKVLSQMVALYCRKNHGGKELCVECVQLLDYACQRSEKCPNIEMKTFCAYCKTHCYTPIMRENIRKVMRFSGPRMLLYHPIAAMRHLVDRIKP